jgi:hypothetical protein
MTEAFASSPLAENGATASRRQVTRSLLLVLAIAIALRVLFAVGAWAVGGESVFYGQDSGTYVEPARELLSRGAFVRQGEPELQRTPGYPVFLMPAVLSGHLTLTVIALQILLSGLTVLATFVLAHRVFDDSRVGVAAAAFYSVEPWSITCAALVETETLFTAIVVWALVLIVTYVRRGRLGHLVAGAAMLAVGAYVRPAGYYLAFGIAILLAVVAVAHRAWRRIPQLALALAVAVAIISPWRLRNRALGYDGFSAAGAAIMYFANGAAVNAALAGVPFTDMQARMGNLNDELYLRLHPDQRTWGQGARYEYMGREGGIIVRRNPLVYARIHLAGVERVVLDPGVIELLRPYGLYPKAGGLLNRLVTYGIVDAVWYLVRTNPLATAVMVVAGTMLITLYTLALSAVVTRRRYLDPAVLVLVASIGYFALIAGGPIGYGRFRHPAMPLICVLAAAGLQVMMSLARRMRERVGQPVRA